MPIIARDSKFSTTRYRARYKDGMSLCVHLLKDYPFNAANRGEFGELKNGTFGDENVQRFSSQCIKRMQFDSKDIRDYLEDIDGYGIRTREIGSVIANMMEPMLEGHGFSGENLEAAKRVIRELLANLGKSAKKKKNDATENIGKKDANDRTDQMFFYGPDEIDLILSKTKDLISKCETPEDIKKALKVDEIEKVLEKNAGSIKIPFRLAVTGRMATTTAFRNVESAMKVGHAMSTNRMYGESDFFTAVDEYATGEGNVGAGMMDYKEFNSSCMYVYEAIYTGTVYDNLIIGRDKETVRKMIAEGLPKSIHSLAVSSPSGGQSGNACNCEPAALLIECRPANIDFTYADAFEKSVRADKDGTITRKSVQKLLDAAEGFERRQGSGSGSKYGITTSHWLWFTKEDGISFDDSFENGKAENFKGLPDLCERLEEILFEETK